MTGWKRKLIWLATFCAGAVYILAFMLPAEIGGGIDRHGMYAPTLVGSRLYYSYGVRETSQPRSEHSFDCGIAMLDLSNTSLRQPAFNSSVFRNDDFRGAKRPVVFDTQTGFKMLFLGIGKDDRARICLAESEDGTNWTVRPKAVFEVPTQISARGPSWFNAFQSGTGYRVVYSVVKNRQAVLYSATSANLEQWTDAGEYLVPPDHRSVVSFSSPDGIGFVSYEQSPEGAGQLLTGPLDSLSYDATSSLSYQSVVSQLPASAKIVELKALPESLLVVFGTPTDSRLKVCLLQRTATGEWRLARNSQQDGAVVALGSDALDTRFAEWSKSFSNFLPVLVSFGFLLGLINVCRLHSHRVRFGPDRIYSVITLCSAAAMIVAEIGFRLTGKKLTSTIGQWEDFLFMKMYFPLGGTVFGLLSAYLISASFRAFRIRTWEASVLTLVAALVLITQVPAGQLIGAAVSPDAQAAGANMDQSLREVRTWILLVPNDAVQRAIGFGAFVGALAMAMRTWLSLDRASLE